MSTFFMQMETRKKKHRGGAPDAGFTLLLAALISSIVLVLGASIFGIAQKELTLSSIGRDSQFAFYAADTGAECALYWDIRHQYFAPTPPSETPMCDEETLAMSGDTSSYPYTVAFEFEPNGFCVDVEVSKSLNETTGAVDTVVRADGFSTGCALIATNPRTLQRSVELAY